MTAGESEQNAEHAGGGGGAGESDISSGLEGLDPAAGVTGGQPGEGARPPRVLTVTLTPEEQAKIDTVRAPFELLFCFYVMEFH